MKGALAVVTAFVLGMLTSWAQGWLPDALSSFANSVSGWTALTVVVIALARPRLVIGAVLGVLCFIALVLGYTVASELRGYPYHPLFWSLVGLVGGPFVGAAAASLRLEGRPLAPALGSGLVSGVLVADGIYGLTVVADSTSPGYWIGSIAVGVVLLALVATIRLRRPGAIVVQAVTFAATVAATSAVFAIINVI